MTTTMKKVSSAEKSRNSPSRGGASPYNAKNSNSNSNSRDNSGKHHNNSNNRDNSGNSTNKRQSLEEAPLPDAFGPAMRETKIRNLKQKCKEVLGGDEEKFTAVYQFLKKARGGSGGEGGEGEGGEVYIGESNIFDGIRKLGVNPADCFLVEQLLFLEEMATGSR